MSPVGFDTRAPSEVAALVAPNESARLDTPNLRVIDDLVKAVRQGK